MTSIIVPEGATREQWHAERGVGVTASRAHAIARGGTSTWKRELEQQMNGSTFRGNAATAAGSNREAALLDLARLIDASIRPNTALFGATTNPLHRATPDGIGDGIVAEVKSHEHGYKGADVGPGLYTFVEAGHCIPADHLSQMQFQMHVRDAGEALYGFEIRDEDDQPPLDGATFIRVPRDQDYIDWLIARADSYIAWRDEGCPDVWGLDDPAVAAAVATWAPLKSKLDKLAAKEKAANAALRTAIADTPHATRFGAIGMGEQGGFQLTVTEKVTIDEAAWRAANPDGYQRVQDVRAQLAITEAAAQRAFPKTTRAQTLRFQEAPND